MRIRCGVAAGVVGGWRSSFSFLLHFLYIGRSHLHEGGPTDSSSSWYRRPVIQVESRCHVCDGSGKNLPAPNRAAWLAVQTSTVSAAGKLTLHIALPLTLETTPRQSLDTCRHPADGSLPQRHSCSRSGRADSVDAQAPHARQLDSRCWHEGLHMQQRDVYVCIPSSGDRVAVGVRLYRLDKLAANVPALAS